MDENISRTLREFKNIFATESGLMDLHLCILSKSQLFRFWMVAHSSNINPIDND